MKKLKFENDARKKPTLYISKDDVFKLYNMVFNDVQVTGVFLWTEDLK